MPPPALAEVDPPRVPSVGLADAAGQALRVTRKHGLTLVPTMVNEMTSLSAQGMLSFELAEERKAGCSITETREDGFVVYTITKGEMKDRFFVDPESHRIVRRRTTSRWGQGPDSGDIVTFTREYDYPDRGPADIYSLGVPRDAKIVDERRSGSCAPEGQ